MPAQKSFTLLKRYYRLTAGGSRSHEKYERPLSRGEVIHLVLKSENARGDRSFRHDAHRVWIKSLLKTMGAKFGVQILDYANVSTHLHLKIKIQTRHLFQAFLKAVMGQIGKRLKRPGERKFWSQSAFTRVLKTAFEDLGLKGYFQANRIEAKQNYKAREDYRSAYNGWLKTLRRCRGLAP